jgi:hypothetical protein
MAWSPFQRANAGIIWVEQPGDYANPIPTTAATGPPGPSRNHYWRPSSLEARAVVARSIVYLGNVGYKVLRG